MTTSIYVQLSSTGIRTHQVIVLVDMIEDMHDYGVYTDAVDIVFDVEELENSDVDEDEHANQCFVFGTRKFELSYLASS